MRPRVGAQTYVCGIGAPMRLRGISALLAVFAYRRRACTHLLLEHRGHGVDLANVVQREHVLDRHLRARGALGSRSSKVAALMGSALCDYSAQTRTVKDEKQKPSKSNRTQRMSGNRDRQRCSTQGLAAIRTGYELPAGSVGTSAKSMKIPATPRIQLLGRGCAGAYTRYRQHAWQNKASFEKVSCTQQHP